MEYRQGKCSDCGAEYKIPASFAHDVARCKECGGTVRIGAGSETARPVPARKAAEPASSGPKVVGSRLKKGQGSTLARLQAQREAEAAASKPAAKAKTVSKAKPAPPARPSRRRAGAAVAATASDGDAGDAPRRPARGGRRSGARRERPEKKKKSPVPILAGIGGLVLIGAAGWFFWGDVMGTDADGVQAEEIAQSEETPAEELPTEAEEIPEPEETDPEGDVPAEADPAAAEEPDPFAAAEKPAKPVADPSTVDLTQIPDFGPAQGCTQERFVELTATMATFMDLDAGAKGTRSGGKLEKEGRLAFPIIINHMKTIDFGTDDGVRKGDMCQKTLERVCYGRNFGWKYTTSPEDHLFNKKVVTYWAKQWEKVEEEGIEYWIKMTKLDEKDKAAATALREEFGGDATPMADAGGMDAGMDDDLDVD